VSCEIDLSLLFSSQLNPGTLAGFLRSGYGDPAGPPTDGEYDHSQACYWSIRVYYAGEPYEFKWFYVGQSMRITSTFGQRGNFSFSYADLDETQQTVPFIITNDQAIEIWAGSTQCASGYVEDPSIQTVLEVRADYSEACIHAVSCVDLYSELELKPVKEIYTGKKLGFILKDVVRNYTGLDASDIDATLGFTVDSFPINKKTPAQVLTHIADLLGMTYWIEASTKKLKLSTKDNAETRFSTVITNQNLYEIFSIDDQDGARPFSLRRQTNQIKTAIELEYSQRYDAGTVNVSVNSDIVVGYGSPPETDWDNLPAGLQFKLKSSDAIYPVEKNNSAGATQEIRLSSPFKESTATNQAYELLGNRGSIYLSNEEAIGVRRMIRGGDGIVIYQVSADDNHYTDEEAFRLAQALLVLSEPLPQGEATTWNSVFQELPLVAGRVLEFALESNTRRFVGGVVIQQVDITDEGGYVTINGEDHPYCRIDFRFTQTFTTDQAQWRKVYQDLRRVKVGLDTPDTELRKRAQVRETLILANCIHPIYPVESGQTIEFDDPVETRDATGRALYYTELDFTLSPWSYSYTSD
jgi:hypothetical protein